MLATKLIGACHSHLDDIMEQACLSVTHTVIFSKCLILNVNTF